MMGTDICIVTEYMSKGSLYRILHDEGSDVNYSIIKKVAFWLFLMLIFSSLWM
jgi:hypothetical protein